MATKFLEPGGDATFDMTIWDASAQTNPTIATDFLHGSHVKCLKYAVNAASSVGIHSVCSDTGGRGSFYFYINAFPNAVCSFLDVLASSYGTGVFVLRMTSAGVLQLFSGGVQLGSNGSTLTTGSFRRLSYAYTVSSTTVYTFNCWLDGVSALSVSNTGTLAATGTADVILGNVGANLTFDLRTSDHYFDDSSSLTDTGNIWVTAKRPNANGTTNGFSTQIGVGGSGYGSGHSPQVNERALSTTNGWSMIGAGSAITEEYSIEAPATGDIDISRGTVIDYMGWIYAKAALGETGQIVVGGTSSNVSLTNANTRFYRVAGSSVYPAGGIDIGLITSTTVTTVSLYECGVIVAFVPAVAPKPFRTFQAVNRASTY